MFRVPLLLQTSLAVIYRLSPSATDSLVPYTDGTGYNASYREDVVYDATRQGKTVRERARSEMPAVRVPCQVESGGFERLRQGADGDVADSSMILVVHKQDLRILKLIDLDTNELFIKVNDRVSHLESSSLPGKVTQQFQDEGFYITQTEPRSQGFGPDGFDLYLLHLDERQKGVV
jgi:hypothetical protein